MKFRESKGCVAVALIASSFFYSNRMMKVVPRQKVSLVGVIMDSKCAITGSHHPIMKQVGARDARDCTLKCAMDGSFELYDPDTQDVYQLDDQQKPEPFAGVKVKVSGVYEENSQTIEVDTIEAVP
jgi:hypothetical protein